MKSLHLKVIRDLRTLGLQVVSIGLLITVAISVLISSWGAYEALRAARDQFYRQFNLADAFADMVAISESGLMNVRSIPGVQEVEARIVDRGLIYLSQQLEPANGHFVSLPESPSSMNKIYLRSGRIPEPNNFDEVIVHEAFAQAHKLRPGDSLSVAISGIRRSLKIVGIGLSPEHVYALGGDSPFPDDKHFGIIWAPQSSLALWTSRNQSWNNIILRLSPEARWAQVKTNLDSVLEPFGRLTSYDRSEQPSAMFVEDEIRQQRVMGSFLPAVFMAVGLFILNVLLSRLIALHRLKIGTLKALGYTANEITGHYFQITTLILLMGIVPGILFGDYLGRVYADLYLQYFRFPKIPYSMSWLSLGIGVLAGLIPGWASVANGLRKIYHLQPAEALRPPSPPRFQKGFLEGLTWLHEKNLYSKMVLRTLVARPLRFLLSATGIAVSIALMITASFWSDMISFMINQQFYEFHREDVFVSFSQPMSSRAVVELEQLPGVIMVESQRRIPVRVRVGALNKDTELVGLDSHAKLSRVVDLQGRPLSAPASGLLLSRYFESKGVRQGDLIIVKSVGGRPIELNLPVVGFVDDMVGHRLYASSEVIHQWFDEPLVSSVGLIRSDQTRLQETLSALKERPLISAVSSRARLVAGFHEVYGAMMNVSMWILYSFSLAIAVAVIYNSVRLGFSERSWELASLRILGVSLNRSFEVLFLDIAAQVVVALAPGLVFGYFLARLSTRITANETFSFPFVIQESTYARAIVFLLAAFALSALVLWNRVRRQDLSEALKARE